MISHYTNIGYNINELQQTACLVVNPITLLSSLIARRWVVIRLYDGSDLCIKCMKIIVQCVHLAYISPPINKTSPFSF